VTNDVILRTLIDVLVAIELSDEDLVSADAAASIFEDVVASLGALPESGRNEFISVAERMALETPNAERREVLMGLPDALDLLPDE
jgi:hypothetical protein